MSDAPVLLIEDEKNLAMVLSALLEREGISVRVCHDSREALRALEEHEDFSVVLTDLFMPGPSGMEILHQVKRERPNLPVVLMTAYGTIETAVSALKAGAFDFVTKPIDQGDLIRTIRRAMQSFEAHQKEAQFDVEPETSWIGLLGDSQPQKRLREEMMRYAPTELPLTIIGEVGSGREQFARVLHRHSSRRASPFLRVLCQEGIDFQEELWGDGLRPGKIQLARTGTLFLDDAWKLDLRVQDRLLGEGVGERGPRWCFGLESAPEFGLSRFQPEFQMKFLISQMRLAPLRERPQDLTEISEEILRRSAERLGVAARPLSPDLVAWISAQSWRGNFRELESFLERALILAPYQASEIDHPGGEFNLEVEKDTSVTDFKEEVRRRTRWIERDLIEKALHQCDGNITRTAQYLQLSRKGLQLKLKELGIRVHPKSE
jgi:DNA-binding NtrC family response regulator